MSPSLLEIKDRPTINTEDVPTRVLQVWTADKAPIRSDGEGRKNNDVLLPFLKLDGLVWFSLVRCFVSFVD